MTLVIAHRFKNQISLSSDSRITFGSRGYIDFGVKIFSIRFKLYSPINAEDNSQSLDYDYNIGLAVVGSLINAYTIKESIAEILQNLQYMEGRTEISMDSIARLIFKVYEKTSNQLSNILGKDGCSEIIVTGYCPKKKINKIFKFSVKDLIYSFPPFHIEILEKDGIEFFGSGATAAITLYDLDNKLSTLKIVREVISDSNITSVGGGLQYGEFVDNNFTIFGVENYSVNPNGTFKEYLYTLRGVNLYREEFEMESDGFHIAYNFKRPFEVEINNLLNAALDNF